MTSRRRFARRIAARFFVRFHMSLIFVATVGAALVATRLLFLAGVDTLALRYALAVAAAYAVFFVFVRLWVLYVTRVAPSDPGLDFPDVWPGGGGGEGAVFQGGGGQFGGGGASGTFDSSVDEVPTLRDTGGVGSSGGDGGEWFSLDLDDAWVLVLALLILAACLGGAAIWLVWQAPVILPEAAFEVLLASGLVGAARRGEARGWGHAACCDPRWCRSCSCWRRRRSWAGRRIAYARPRHGSPTSTGFASERSVSPGGARGLSPASRAG